MIKIVFAGTGDFSAKYLEEIIQDGRFSVSAIISQEDKKIGRKQILTETETKKIGKKYGIPVFQPEKKSEITEILKNEKPDFFVVVAYGKILPKESLEIAKFNINAHGSILPKYRGASPIQSAILNGDSETGISTMNLEEKMDAGAVWNIHKCKIEKFDTTEKIFEKMKGFAKNFCDDLGKIFKGELKPQKQDENLATYCKKISKEDGKINFEKESSKEILQKLNAFTPWPGVFCYFGEKKLKILKASFDKKCEKNHIKKPGKVIVIDKKIFINTIHGFLEILEVQLEGKKAQKISDFINGNQNFIGTTLT
ncbi:methionyl-tRNA formyltransferase [Candidatus Gracilibacteria bacterium]|nr:methionyl-tRNA formyltransferase [Candidatus Gracilibacteria bacterium]